MLPSPAIDAKTLREWGAETLTMIRRDYYLPKSHLYKEEIGPGKGDQPCFNWSSGVLLSALAAGAKADPQFVPWLREYADAMQVYWNPQPPVAGFDVLPGPKPIDRYYDDNAWMAMALVETYEVLKDKKYLDQAAATVKYVLSGEDDKLGGGVYWRESDRASKNTCSNGPAAAACLALYKHRPDPALTGKALTIYAWTSNHLQDPADGLYWDSINLDGHIDRTKWSYNTGLMLRVMSDENTSVLRLRDAHTDLVNASYKRWLANDPDPVFRDEAKFAHLLMENWFRYAKVARPESAQEVRARALPVLQTLHQRLRSLDGHYGSRWDHTPWSNVYSLIDQSSAARAYFEAAAALD